ncbi:hypothetical protein MMC21_006366 [Puttea exsequens]|nr:hypothetical protein [Puttea exsequens]
MSKEGKKKETEVPPSPSAGGRAFAERLGASASGLLQNTLSRPSPSNVTQNLASLNTDAEKGQSITGSATHGEASSSSEAAASRSSQIGSREPPRSDNFRSDERLMMGKQNSQVAFDDFMARSQGYGPDFEPLQGQPPSSGRPAADSGRQVEGSTGESVEKFDLQRAWDQVGKTPSENEDGAAVVALLTDSGFSIKTEPDDDDFDALDFDGQLRNSHERSSAGQDPGKAADHFSVKSSLDLIPDFNTPLDNVHTNEHLSGLRLPDTTLDDVQPWAEILGRYHDEVWGDMLPLVQQARREVKAAAAESNDSSQDRPALRRLGLLLRHLSHA